jgi:putative photosynthetic complex assembly protein
MNTTDAPRANAGFPRGALLGGAGLVGFALLAAIAVRTGIVAPVADPDAARAAAHATVQATRDLHFADRSDGAVEVRDAGTGAIVDVITPGREQGFVRGVMRGLARERHQHRVGSAPPFRLARWSDGSLTLHDAATGRTIELGSFGPTNRAAFETMLPGNMQAATTVAPTTVAPTTVTGVKR